MTTSTPPDNTVLVLRPPMINGQTKLVVGAHIGVPLVAYDLVTDGEGAVVLVDPPSSGTMDPGDVMELWLEDELAALDSKTIVDPNVRTTLRIPKGRLHPDRVNKLFYTVRRGSANRGTSTPSLEILYNRIRPGLKDRLTDPGGHSELRLLLPDEIKNGVGPDFVSAEVCVAYPYCRAYDLITLKCNGELLDPKPKVNPNQAPQPPNPGDETPITICFTVTRAYLDEAKRLDKKLHFSYTVTDQIGNGPDTDAPWSPVQSVDEDLDGTRLPMPILLERKEDFPGDDASIIDLEKLAGNPLLVVVLTTDNRFVVGYDVIATYTATNTGQPADVVVTVPGKVEADPFGAKKTLFLEVPNDQVIAGSQVTVTYELRRSNGDLVGNSRLAQAQVTGTVAPKLNAPMLMAPAINPIDPTRYPDGVTVRVEYLEAEENDEAQLVLLNALPGTPTFGVVKLNKNKRANFVIGNALLQQHEGRNLRLHWVLIRRGVSTESPILRLTIMAALTSLNFDNAPYTLGPAGRFTVALELVKNGQGLPDRTVELTLPSGFAFSDGASGSRSFITDNNGKLLVNGIRGSSASDTYTLTARHEAQSATAEATVTRRENVGTITGIPYPYDIAISPDGTRAYVVGYDYPSRYGALSRVDVLTHRVIDSLALGNNLTCVAAGPDNSCIYVIKTGLDTLSPGLIVVDSTRFEVIANVAFSFNPFSVVISPDGSRAFVCGTEIHSAPHNGRLAIVDTATYKVLHTINLLQLNTVGIAINPEGSRVYITNANGDDGGTVSIVDTQNYSILDKIQVGSNPHEIVVSPDGSRVYTVRTSGDLLVVIDARTSTVIRYVPLGIGAWHLALSYDGQFLCASQWYLGSKIVIVDTTTFSVRTISVGRDPVGVAFSSDGTRVYVCKYLDSSVSVIARE